MRMPTGAWRRLYSLTLIRRVTRSTSARVEAGGDDLARCPGRLPCSAPGSRRAPRRAAGCPGRSGSGAARPTGGARDDALGDRPAPAAVGAPLAAVLPVRQAVDQRLGHVLDDREAAGHVAVQRAVAGRHLALVAGGQHDASRTCSTAPSAACRGCAPGCSPRSCPRAGRRTRAARLRGRRRTSARSRSRRSARPGARAMSRASIQEMSAV